MQPVNLRFAALAAAISEDMSGGHGVAWWSGVDEPRNLLIADYILGLTEGITNNLSFATMHHARYTEMQATADFNVLRRLRAGSVRGEIIAPGTPGESDRQLEADGHLRAFFLAIGSALDNLAGVLMGVTGMPPIRGTLVRADWGALADWRKDGAAPRITRNLTSAHHDLINRVVDEVDTALAAGPTEWVEWALDLRNTLVHRAPRLSINVVLPRGKGIGHPLPRHPAQTHAESFARSTSIRGDLIAHQASETMQTILDAAATLAAAIGAATLDAWDTRRGDSDLHHQPERQWPTLAQGRVSDFDPHGQLLQLAPPGHGQIAMAPTTAQRLRLGRLEDDDRGAWKGWLLDDASRAPKEP